MCLDGCTSRKSYLRALVQLFALFEEGVQEVRALQHEQYYACILKYRGTLAIPPRLRVRDYDQILEESLGPSMHQTISQQISSHSVYSSKFFSLCCSRPISERLPPQGSGPTAPCSVSAPVLRTYVSSVLFGILLLPLGGCCRGRFEAEGRQPAVCGPVGAERHPGDRGQAAAGASRSG